MERIFFLYELIEWIRNVFEICWNVSIESVWWSSLKMLNKWFSAAIMSGLELSLRSPEWHRSIWAFSFFLEKQLFWIFTVNWKAFVLFCCKQIWRHLCRYEQFPLSMSNAYICAVLVVPFFDAIKKYLAKFILLTTFLTYCVFQIEKLYNYMMYIYITSIAV